jgi:hypothetical protein
MLSAMTAGRAMIAERAERKLRAFVEGKGPCWLVLRV